ncbi:unnamed protein product, partial [marine sediment metagenome]
MHAGLHRFILHYIGKAKVMVVQASNDANSELGYLNSQQLVQTYAELLLTDPILDEVSKRVNFAIKKNQISISQVRDTRILSVTIEDIDAARAAQIANLLTDVLVENNAELQNIKFSASEESVLNQIQSVQEQINILQDVIEQQSQESLEGRISSVEGQIERAQQLILEINFEIDQIAPGFPDLDLDQISASDLSILREKNILLDQANATLGLYQDIYFNLLSDQTSGNNGNSSSTNTSQLESTLVLYQQIYANLLGNFENIRLAQLENSTAIVKVDPANPSGSPVRPKPMQNIILGFILGIMVATGIAFLIEFLDDTVRSSDDVTRIIDKPILGYIPEIPNDKRGIKGNIYSISFPRSP